ncbi:ubiquitin-conjugating enzyme subfamily protein, partial [Toxoplasma gondii p89]
MSIPKRIEKETQNLASEP